jgi:hypothetical protein
VRNKKPSPSLWVETPFVSPTTQSKECKGLPERRTMSLSSNGNECGTATVAMTELHANMALAALEQAVYQSLAALDRAERREYDEAIAQAPLNLVRQEAPVEDFLWTENYHTDRAALRLARYWKARKHVFGADRWLLPLVQTGHGALGTEEIELLRSGYFVVVVRPENKGIVTLIDKGRLQRTPSVRATIRLCFYLTALYAKEIRNGYISILIERGVSRPPPLISKDVFAIFNVAMPIPIWKRKAFVVQACYEPGKESLLNYLTFQLAETLQFNSGRSPTKITGNSIRHTRLLLHQATGGVEAECLPYCLGGMWGEHMFVEWIRQRLSVESCQIGIPMALPNLENEHTESMNKEYDSRSVPAVTVPFVVGVSQPPMYGKPPSSNAP